MRKAEVFVHGVKAGVLQESLDKNTWFFLYSTNYKGPPVSLTLPVERGEFNFKSFPPFFEGLLPEGLQLEALLRICKIDRYDLFGQLVAVGGDTVGAVTVQEAK
ncbi:MAG: toxin HipA [Deltaproteobacteria bacterium]|jgi:serine/threonine-protein kinase HipA|nr:toxin HipA [Deltaproteobacteria bacterium]MBT4527299.1 toxin HipA [Deltaproteobacteria bacterium]